MLNLNQYYKESLRLCVTKWWISPFISSGYTEVHIWLLVESILLAQLWYMRVVFCQCCWVMTWGNGLEEHREIVSWKMSICAWQSFGTSPSAAVRGEPRINVKLTSWPFKYLYATISCLFMTAETGSLSWWKIYSKCECTRDKRSPEAEENPEPGDWEILLGLARAKAHTHWETGEYTHSCSS